MDDEDIALTSGAGRPTPPPDALVTARADAAAKTPRAAAVSVRRSDAYLAAQIARAVARGQRVL